MKSKNNAAFIFSLVFVMFLIGEGYADETIGLHDAISLALKNDNRYLMAIEKENESQAKVRESWGKLWPDLSISAAGTGWGADKGTFTGSDGQIDFRFIKGSFAINPGTFYNSLKITQDSHVVSVNEERRMKSETTANVIRLYYLTMLDEEIIKLRTDSVKALEENLRVVTAGFKGGSLASIDQLRAKVSLANERTRLINAENDYQNMRSSLNLLLGRDIAAPLTLDSNSLTIQKEEITKLTAIDATEQNRRLAELVGIAMKNRPEIVQLRYKKDIAEASGNLDRSVYMWPNFFIEGNYGTSKVINQQEVPASAPNAQLFNEITDMLSPPGWNKSWSVTAGVSYKFGALSPLDPSHAKSLQDESRQKQSDIETDDFIKQLHLEVQKGLLKMISAAHALESQSDNTQSAQEYFRIAVLQFKNGIIDNTKLLDANVELKNAQTLYIQALFDLQTAKSDLNRAIGYDYFQIQ